MQNVPNYKYTLHQQYHTQFQIRFIGNITETGWVVGITLYCSESSFNPADFLLQILVQLLLLHHGILGRTADAIH